MEENWKEIPSLGGFYQASNLGRIRSVDRITKGRSGYPRPISGRVLSPEKTNMGYLRVITSVNNRVKKYSVARLVLEAFNGYSELQADHINRDRQDNRIENLRYVTCRENQQNRANNCNAVGVQKKNQKWQARARIEGVEQYLGVFDTEIEASRAYVKATSGV